MTSATPAAPPSSASDDTYKVAVLMDDLKDDEISYRINSIKNLSTIAQSLGPQRTRDELVPFLEDVAQDDEEEVVTLLAEQLKDFIPLIGGSNHISCLQSLLETLLASDEPIQSKAIDSFASLADQVDLADLQGAVADLVEHLSRSDWATARLAAASCFVPVLRRLPTPELQDSVCTDYFAPLVKDKTPMVRKAAAANLAKIFPLLDLSPRKAVADFWNSVYGEMFTAVTTDSQDSVRLLGIDVLVSVAAALRQQQPKEFATVHNPRLVSAATALIADASWRVRYMAAERFGELAAQLDGPEMREQFLGVLLNLLRDNEAEVRTGISKQLPSFCKFLAPEVILEQILPCVRRLAKDSSEHVRAALASELTEMAPHLGKENTLQYLLPVFLRLLRDDDPDVRLNVISKLKSIGSLVGRDVLAKALLPAIHELASNPQWRVRLEVIRHVPLLAEQFGEQFFNERLAPLCLGWLWDAVYSIREAAVENIQRLTLVFGVKWSQERIVAVVVDPQRRAATVTHNPASGPESRAERERERERERNEQESGETGGQGVVAKPEDADSSDEEFYSEIFKEMDEEKKNNNLAVDADHEFSTAPNNYLVRLTTLFVLTKLVPVVDRGMLADVILQFIVEKSVHDEVPNIRFNAAKALLVIAKRLVAPQALVAEIEAEEAQREAERGEPASGVPPLSPVKPKADRMQRQQETQKLIAALQQLVAQEKYEDNAELVKNVVLETLKEKLVDDADPDVRFYAKKAVEEITELLDAAEMT